MPTIVGTNPHLSAYLHFSRALAFYAAHDQQDSAIGELTAGLVALSAQVARIELAVISGYDA